MKNRSEMKIQMAIARAKRTVLGRTLCRLAGDRAGGVMMEYVILGVLVAAAVAAMVAIFGDQMKIGFDIMIDALMGKGNSAVTKQVNRLTTDPASGALNKVPHD